MVTTLSLRSTQYPILCIKDLDNPSKIWGAVRGFEEPDDWIDIKENIPIKDQHHYSTIQIPIDNLDDIRQVWIHNSQLIRFKSSIEGIRNVLTSFPVLLSEKLQETLETLNIHLKLEAIHAIVQKALENGASEQMQLFRGSTHNMARSLIAGENKGYMLLTRFSTENDPFIGNGAFKRVKLCLGIHDAEIKVVAVCRLEDLTGEEKLIRNELKILQKVRGHDRLLQLEAGLESNNKVYFITEYMNLGDMEAFLRDNPDLSFKQKLRIAQDIALGLANLHQVGIVYRDLKVSNIFLTKSDGMLRAKIGDLGTCSEMDDEESTLSQAGTPLYFSPEKMRAFVQGNQEARNEKEKPIPPHFSTPAEDVWALGLLFYSLFHPKTGSFMHFQNASEYKESIINLTTDEIDRDRDSSGIEPNISLLILHMLNLSQRHRISALNVYKALQKIDEGEDYSEMLYGPKKETPSL